jgi:glycosyltransferase involved in cell wall biosynthesis
MLMFPDWERELRSNRWHYATRWAKRVPVVLVQPTESRQGVRSYREARIPNCRVLHVTASLHAGGYWSNVETQTGQLLGDMREHGVQRPLLWLYNPQLVGVYGCVPSVCRVFHATENYFQFAGATRFFLAQTRTALSVSDLVIAVSEGVAASIAREALSVPVHTITNGCDYAFYARAAPDPELAKTRVGFERVAVYAGNINWRLDFPLLGRCAVAFPRTFFALYGPVVGLRGQDRRDWTQLEARPNVRHFGPVKAEKLPAVYAAADVGLVPYKDDPWIVENGFPLKVLEMCAAGLPVVTSKMKPIEKLAAAITVCVDADGFISAFARRSRDALSTSQLAEMQAVCSRHDYDRKFDQVIALAAPIASETVVASPRGDEVRSALPAVTGAKAWLQGWLRGVGKIMPVQLRNRIAPRARRALQNWLER